MEVSKADLPLVVDDRVEIDLISVEHDQLVAELKDVSNQFIDLAKGASLDTNDPLGDLEKREQLYKDAKRDLEQADVDKQRALNDLTEEELYAKWENAKRDLENLNNAIKTFDTSNQDLCYEAITEEINQLTEHVEKLKRQIDNKKEQERNASINLQEQRTRLEHVDNQVEDIKSQLMGLKIVLRKPRSS